MKNLKILKRKFRKIKVKAKIKSGKRKIRLSVYRSNRYLYVQLIDDRVGKTLVAVTDRGRKKEKGVRLTKIKRAFLLGEKLATLALEKGIKEVVFDRNGYRFHGRIKSLAEGARSKGLKF